MDYCAGIEGYPKSELNTDYQDGKIVALAYGYEIVESDTIGCIQVLLEERTRELGIRHISQCSIMNESFQVLHEEYNVPDETFNYAGGNADEEVIECVARAYRVSPEIIDIEPLY